MNSPAQAKARAFLAAFRVSGNVTLAAAAVPMEKTLHYRWLKSTPLYARDFAIAETEFGDVLEAAAVARAKDGILEAVFYQGQPCGAIRKYSDGLMIALLKRFKPEKYAARLNAELSGPGGGPISVRDPELSVLSDDDLASLRKLAVKAALAAANRPGDGGSAEAED